MLRVDNKHLWYRIFPEGLAMPLPLVTKETADSLAKMAKENPQHHIEVLKKLQNTNPVMYQYLDFSLTNANV